jgi:hypothetical protein
MRNVASCALSLIQSLKSRSEYECKSHWSIAMKLRRNKERWIGQYSVLRTCRARSVKLTLARPKSRILACPRLVTKMLAGQRSRDLPSWPFSYHRQIRC